MGERERREREDKDKGKFEEEVERLKSAYKVSKSFSALVYGEKGVGKTQLLSTARRPILIHSFDPKGSITLAKGIAEGWIFVDTSFESERSDHPVQAKRWEDKMYELIQSHFFDNIGTFAIDSFTTFSDAFVNYVANKANRKRNIPAIQDWIPVMNAINDWVKEISSLPCDFIMTAHLSHDKDELSGRTFASILSHGEKMRKKLPVFFAEQYYLGAKETSKGLQRYLLTETDGYYPASTRIGSEGKFQKYEEPNIMKLLKKSGIYEEK